MPSPSIDHAALLELFRTRPTLAAELLVRALGATLPPYTEARVEHTDFSQLRPAEYQADLVVLLSHGRPVHGIVVEVQLKKDAAKRHSWPVYLCALHARFKCPVSLLIVAPVASVATWAASTIAIGPAFSLTPFVLGSADVPRVTDWAEARAAPELAVLSAIAHGKGADGAAVARAALHAMQLFEGSDGVLYLDLVKDALGPATKRALETELMNLSNYEWKTEPAKTLMREAKQEGKAEGKAEGILAVLRARSIPASAEATARIQSCLDFALLDTWLTRAVTAATAEDIF